MIFTIAGIEDRRKDQRREDEGEHMDPVKVEVPSAPGGAVVPKCFGAMLRRRRRDAVHSRRGVRGHGVRPRRSVRGHRARPRGRHVGAELGMSAELKSQEPRTRAAPPDGPASVWASGGLEGLQVSAERDHLGSAGGRSCSHPEEVGELIRGRFPMANVVGPPRSRLSALEGVEPSSAATLRRAWRGSLAERWS